MSAVGRTPSRKVGVETGTAEGRTKREEVVVSSEEDHVPDRLPCAKTGTVPIVPPFAEAINFLEAWVAGIRVTGPPS